MTREDQALARLRAADPLPDLDRIEPDELAAIFSMLDARRRAVKTQAPVREAKDRISTGRAWRGAFVFALAAVIVLIAVGVGFLLFGNPDAGEVISPSETRLPDESAPDVEPPAASMRGDPQRYQRLVDAELVGGVSAGSLPDDRLRSIVEDVPGCDVNASLEKWITQLGTEFGIGEADFLRGRVAMVVAGCPAIDPAAVAAIAPGLDAADVEEMMTIAAGPTSHRPGRQGLPEFSWTTSATHSPDALASLAPVYGGYLMLSGGEIQISPDGETWTPAAGYPEGGEVISVFYAYGLYVAEGSDDESNAMLWTSTDLETWTAVSDQGVNPAGFAATASGFVAVGIDELITGPNEDIIENMHVGVWTSPDGQTWTQIPNDDGVFSGLVSDDSMMIPRGITCGPVGCVIVGEDDFTTGDVKGAVWYSPDGIEWERVPHNADVFGVPNTEAWVVMSDVTHGPNGFVAVGSVDGPRAGLWFSPDGREWTSVHAAGAGAVDFHRVAAIQDGYLAVGEIIEPNPTANDEFAMATSPALWFSVDGVTWVELSTDSFTPNGEHARLDQVVTEGDTVVIYSVNERPMDNPPEGDPEAKEWFGIVWYSLVR